MVDIFVNFFGGGGGACARTRVSGKTTFGNSPPCPAAFLLTHTLTLFYGRFFSTFLRIFNPRIWNLNALHAGSDFYSRKGRSRL